MSRFGDHKTGQAKKTKPRPKKSPKPGVGKKKGFFQKRAAPDVVEAYGGMDGGELEGSNSGSFQRPSIASAQDNNMFDPLGLAGKGKDAFMQPPSFLQNEQPKQPKSGLFSNNLAQKKSPPKQTGPLGDIPPPPGSKQQ